MENEYRYLLHLFKSYIRNITPDKPEHLNWNNFFQLAQIHSVDGIVGYMVKQYGLSDSAEIMLLSSE